MDIRDRVSWYLCATWEEDPRISVEDEGRIYLRHTSVLYDLLLSCLIACVGFHGPIAVTTMHKKALDSSFEVL